jgi:hypothetical protein
VSRSAALALLLLAAPAEAATRGRMAFSLLAGGGWSSDVFVGAGLGPDGVLQISPAGRLDLSLSPEWKLAATADVSYGRYLSTEYTAVGESAAVEVRWLGGPSWEASLAAGAEHAAYSIGSPLDPALVTSPSVSDTFAATASPLLRLRALGLEWRAAGVLGARSSSAAGGDIPEHDYAALAGLMWPLGEGASLAGTYKFAHADSTRLDFTLDSHALFAALGWRLGDFDLRAQLQLQTAAFATGARENLGRLTLGLAYPILPSVDLEAVYSFAGNRSNDPSRPSASRHLGFLALRWRFAEVEW